MARKQKRWQKHMETLIDPCKNGKSGQHKMTVKTKPDKDNSSNTLFL